MSVSQEEISELSYIKEHVGFKIYIRLLNDRFDSVYKKLRDPNSDTDKLRGELDGIEYALRVIDSEIQDNEATT